MLAARNSVVFPTHKKTSHTVDLASIKRLYVEGMKM